MKHIRTLIVVAALTTWIMPATQADAAFPGENGRIAFSTDFSRPSRIFTVLPNAQGFLRQLTHVPKRAQGVSSPEWSPNGTKILFTIDEARSGS